MSDASVKKRCPNIAWAFWRARALGLTPRERLVLMAIAERADAEMWCAPTQEMLAEDTGLTQRTVNEAVQDLLRGRKDEGGRRQNPPGCIEAERRKEGLRYKLVRDMPERRPLEWPDMPEIASESVADPVTQNLRISEEVVLAEKPQNSRTSTHEIAPEHEKSSDPDTQILPIPILTPLKESPVERTSLRSVARAQADNVVVLSIDGVAEARLAWNEVCAPVGFPACREMPELRRRKLQRLLATRFAEPGSWREFCVDVAASEFLASGNFGIDWVIKPANLVKIVEGNYRRSRPAPRVVREGTHAAVEQKLNLRPMQPTFDPEPDNSVGRIAQ